MKNCSKCGIIFEPTPSKIKHHSYVCKKCCTSYSVEWAKKNMGIKLERNKKYLQSEKGKEAIYRHTVAFRKKYPEKYKAYNLVVTALRNGSLKKKSCEICGVIKTHAHHENYNKPLEVIWLCDKCHKNHHAMLEARKQ